MEEIMNDFDEKEIIAALERSGYLLESEISKKLSDAGFFIETNQAIKDPPSRPRFLTRM